MALGIVIIGGVAGGMSAATRARRLNETASIIVLEKSDYVSFANCGLPYHLDGRIAQKEKLLVTTPQNVAKRYKIDALVRHEVTEIDRSGKVVRGVDHGGGKPFEFQYDKLILAPGASAILPPIENVNAANVFRLRSLEDALAIRGWLDSQKPRRVAIIGAGFIGLEVAESLRHAGLEVTLIEKASHVLPPLDPQLAPWIEKELAANGVNLITGTGLRSLHASNGRVDSVELDDGRRLDADMVVLSIGVRPNTELAKKAGLALGESGAIAVDRHLRSSDPDIYAVGDAAEVIHEVTGKSARIPLAGPANRHGRLAGEHAATGSSQPAGKVMGTAVVGVFSFTAAVTGLGENAARAAGFDVDVAYVHPLNHAGYYPGAQQMHLKLIYDRATGRVLGAHAVGGAGVDKRIDVIATAIHFRGTIDDLADLDLAYAPQYGSAKDPVHMAAFVAQNQRSGVTSAVSPGPIDGAILLDVRTPQEVAAGALAGSVNIPVDELRSRIGELDRHRPIRVLCQVGLRGYIAQRILQQHGFADVANIRGGYALAVHAMARRLESKA